ncbi:MAG: VCBS repeat-containing protein [Acidobacteriaceae bacterium]|nr:VCBS repeat-containing protein [Acidobacteriaceae bacterium]MBV9778506.1 VCBS repeat-containing protein [Acidobacteriaceae bacterium]
MSKLVHRLFLLAGLVCIHFLVPGTQAQTFPASGAAVPPRITQEIDNSRLITLSHNVHPLARPEFDRGPAPANLPYERMLLVLKRSPDQESALEQLLASQQDPASPQYHKWLTPADFGRRFGPASRDIQVITTWLESQGFQVNHVARGRATVEFSGTASQVETAFHTPIHKFVVDGEEHWANVKDPQIPAALAPVVAGVASLHNFRKKPLFHLAPQRVTGTYSAGSQTSAFNFADGSHGLAPADYAVIYNINALYQAGINGTGATIAIVAKSNINAKDVAEFRSIFSLANNPPQIIVNGPDPGILKNDETEATLDTSWSGAVAPNATVKLVVSKDTNTSDGTDLSVEYIIDNNLADVMSESYGDCEAHYGSGDATYLSNRAQQAAAQGITYLVSTGDSGSAGCDDPNTEKTAVGPFSVNILASTPYTIAVGGTMFDEHGNNAAYWNPNPPGYESALSYIPEDVWNEACASSQPGCKDPGIWAGGGGSSTFFSKPSWQAGVTGIPNDGARDLPDVSLSAASHDPYVLCDQSSCNSSSPSFYGISGTSASAPSFAGIIALVNQKTGKRQGQADPVLYTLAASENLSSCNASSTTLPASNCVFNDVTVGNNAVPGEQGYGTSSAKYPSTTGYDLASGLGSVNVQNLVETWNGSGSVSGAASISPGSLAFGNQNIAATSGAQSVTLTNTGGSSLAITTIGITGAQASDFIQSNNCGSSLGAGASCTISVSFAPIAGGARSASLTFADSAANSPQTVALNGTGVGGVAFGGVQLGDVRVIGDFDGDGKLDVATWRASNGIWYVYESSNPGVLTEEQWGAPGDIPVPGDYDGDGKTDFAVWRPSLGTWYILPSKTRRSYYVQWGAPGDIPVVGDYDGDGKTDLTVWRPSNQIWFFILSGNPNPLQFQWGAPGDVPVSGDFDGSGKSEMAVWRPSDGHWYVISGTNGVPFNQQWGVAGDIPVPADYDGDGVTDFAVFRPSDQNWYIIPSSNPSSPYFETSGAPTNLLATKLAVGSLGVSHYVRVYGDFDGDGELDFATWEPSTGNWFVVPSSSPADARLQQWGALGDVPVPGDYDGDGKADYAVWRPSNGTWYIIPSSNPNSQITKQWGVLGDIPAPANYTGNVSSSGHPVTDIAVWRPGNSTWYIVPSNGANSYSVAWGAPGDVPAPADFEGTGKADVAVWRPGNGTWYVVPSNGGASYSLQWGASGDMPVPGDFDRDGRADFGIWRPSAQSWFIQDSANSSNQIQQSSGLAGNAQIYKQPR